MTKLKKSILLFLIGNMVASSVYAAEKKLDPFNAQIVAKYLSNEERLKLAQTNKKFELLLDRERINREPIRSNKDAKYVPFMQTQQLFAADDYIATDGDGNIIADILKIRFNISIQQIYSMLTNQYIETENGVDYDDDIDEDRNMRRGLVIARNGALFFDGQTKEYNIHNISSILTETGYTSSKRDQYEFEHSYAFHEGSPFSTVYYNNDHQNIGRVSFDRISANCLIDTSVLENGETVCNNKLKFAVDEVSPFAEVDYDTLVNEINMIKKNTLTKQNTYITLCGFADDDQAESVKSLILRDDIAYIRDFSWYNNLELVVLNDRLLDIHSGTFDECSNKCTFVIPDHWKTIVTKSDCGRSLNVYVIINNKLRRLCRVKSENSGLKVYMKKHVNIENGKVIVKQDAENLVETTYNKNLIESGKVNKNGQVLYKFIVPYGVNYLDSYPYFMDGIVDDLEFSGDIYNISSSTIIHDVNNITIPNSVQHIEPSAFMHILQSNINISLPEYIQIHAYNTKVGRRRSSFPNNGMLLFAHNQKDNSYVQVGTIDNMNPKYVDEGKVDHCSVNGENIENIACGSNIVIPSGVKTVSFESTVYRKHTIENNILTIPEGLSSISGEIPVNVDILAFPENCEIEIVEVEQPFSVESIPFELEYRFYPPSIVYMMQQKSEVNQTGMFRFVEPREKKMFNIHVKWNDGSILKIQDQGFEASKYLPLKIKKGDKVFEITEDMLGKTL